MQHKLTRECLGLAGEYAVASELCRRHMYAQLTLGNHKETDILLETERRMLRIQVKAKQSREWPSISGLHRSDDFLVLVDFEGKGDTDRPDFYVLGLEGWKALVHAEQQRQPSIAVDDQWRVTWPDGWKGLNVMPGNVNAAKEQWGRISARLVEDEYEG